jgi:hypothetical protein
MAIKKDKNNSMQDISLDPAIAIHLQNAAQLAADEKRQKETNLTAAQRRKRKKDASRNKVTYDLPEHITDRINAIASQFGEKGVPQNQVVAFLLNFALHHYDDQDIDLNPYLKPSIVPRFSFFLELPE